MTPWCGLARAWAVLRPAEPWDAVAWQRDWAGIALETAADVMALRGARPVAELAAQLAAAGYDGKGVIVGSDHMVAAMLRSRNPAAYATACNPEFDRMADCLANARARAAQQGVGLLVLARMDKATPDWWTQVFANQSVPALHNLHIPFSHMRASTPPMQYQFVWLPAPVSP